MYFWYSFNIQNLHGVFCLVHDIILHYMMSYCAISHCWKMHTTWWCNLIIWKLCSGVSIFGAWYHIALLFSFRCATTVESFPPTPAYSSNHGLQPDLQRIRVLVGAPLKRPPKHQIVTDPVTPMFSSIDSDSVNLNRELSAGAFNEGKKFVCPEGLNDFIIFCLSDFTTVSKEVHFRTRRVRLLGLEVLMFNNKTCK